MSNQKSNLIHYGMKDIEDKVLSLSMEALSLMGKLQNEHPIAYHQQCGRYMGLNDALEVIRNRINLNDEQYQKFIDNFKGRI
jgi:hypothetical protein